MVISREDTSLPPPHRPHQQQFWGHFASGIRAESNTAASGYRVIFARPQSLACTGDYLQTRVTIGRDDGGRGGQQSAGEEGEGQPLGMMVTGHWCCHVMQCVAAAWWLLGILPVCLIFFSRFVLCCQNQDPRQAKKPRKRRQVGGALNLSLY